MLNLNFAINERILFNHLGYSLITSSGVCKHVNGKFLTNCFKSGFDQSSCEAFCTSQTSCVGYMFGNYTPSRCWLFPSESRCPSDFDLYRLTLATSKNDLVAKPFPGYGYACYGKNGNWIFEYIMFWVFLWASIWRITLTKI